jgi:prevent-host-death family protein
MQRGELHMAEEIGSYDAKTKLPEILRRVARGEAFTITNRGKPVADLIPSRLGGQQKTQVAVKNILTARKHRISDKTLAELKNSGRQ